MKNLSIITLTLIFLLFGNNISTVAQEQNIHDKMFEYHSIEAVVWAMPMLNYKGYRDGHFNLGLGYNDIAYHTHVCIQTNVN